MSYKLIILVLCLAGAIILTFLETSVSLQIDDCGYPPLLEEPPIGKRNTWAKNLPVNVFIAAAFSDNQENGIRDALSNWQSERISNQSGVVFNIQVGSAPSNQTGSYCDIRAQAPPAGIPNATDRGAVSTAQGSTSFI